MRARLKRNRFWELVLVPELAAFISPTSRRRQFAALLRELDSRGALEHAQRIKRYLEQYPTQAAALEVRERLGRRGFLETIQPNDKEERNGL